jgi:hypothetical protein
MSGEWKELLAPGTYRLSDRRVVRYTPADIANACRQGNAMIRAGLRVPLCWMHDPRAVPEHLSDLHPDAWLARDWYGDAAEFRVEGGRLLVRPRIPNPAARAQFDRVNGLSPRCQWDWTDERGKCWRGLTIGHVGCTPKPIQRDLGKVRPAFPPDYLSHDSSRARAVEYLSHAERLGDADMPATEEVETENATSSASPSRAVELLEKAGLHLGEVGSWDEFLTALEAAVSTLHGPLGEDDKNATEPAPMAPAMMSHLDKIAKGESRDLERRVSDLFRENRIDGATHRRLLGSLKTANLSHESFDKDCNLKPFEALWEIQAYEKLPAGRFAKQNKQGDLGHALTNTVDPPANLARTPESDIQEAAEDAKRRNA